jgi:hypothetical protein
MLHIAGALTPGKYFALPGLLFTCISITGFDLVLSNVVLSGLIARSGKIFVLAPKESPAGVT